MEADTFAADSNMSIDAAPPYPWRGTLAEVHQLVSVYGEECMSIQMVRRWRSWFLKGRQNVHDDERSGRPVTATDNAAVAAVRNVVEAIAASPLTKY
ncbi:GVQW3 [Cordylochernes scorpioides]|uniref:GVQW3 n=1 Tax=Cordylochernes scorpioides TaxID=51811 RepID=A0ABY6LKG7_9ARAC|nr:GVQW3 [Cordylochernes scorpioides]